jgi:hypothetical protein
MRWNWLISNGVGGCRLMQMDTGQRLESLNIPRIGLPAVQATKALGCVLGFGCENAWGQQITQSDPPQQLGANPI